MSAKMVYSLIFAVLVGRSEKWNVPGGGEIFNIYFKLLIPVFKNKFQKTKHF